MASSRDAGVNVTGFAELRKALKEIDRSFGREVNKGVKGAVERKVLPASKALTPHRTGRLAASEKAFAAGNTAGIRSRLPYANVIHWGGNVPNRESRSTRPKRHFKASEFAARAVEMEADQVVDEIGDAVDRLATRHGFH